MSEREFVKIRIDLNALRGLRYVTFKDIHADEPGVQDLREGQIVECVEEEGDTYLASVVRCDDGRMELLLDPTSRHSALSLTGIELGNETR